MDMDVLNRLIEHKHFPQLTKIIRIYFADELEYGIQSRNMMLDVLSDTIMEFPTTSEEAEKAKREDVMLFKSQKFAPHEADFERIKNVSPSSRISRKTWTKKNRRRRRFRWNF